MSQSLPHVDIGFDRSLNSPDEDPNEYEDELNQNEREADDQLRARAHVAGLAHLLNTAVEDAGETIGFGEQSRQANGQAQAHAKSQNSARYRSWLGH